MRLLTLWALLLVCSTSFAIESLEAPPEPLSVMDRSEFIPGFLPLYWDKDEGKLFADIHEIKEPLIYYNGLSHGVGSNDLGLDRGRLGDTYLVEFDRVGQKVFLTAINTK